jgi:hypothetical protein
LDVFVTVFGAAAAILLLFITGVRLYFVI